MVESTGLENRRCESIRGFESHSLRQKTSYLRKYPSGRRGSPAKGVGRQKRREGSNPSFRAKPRKPCDRKASGVFFVYARVALTVLDLVQICFYGKQYGLQAFAGPFCYPRYLNQPHVCQNWKLPADRAHTT